MNVFDKTLELLERHGWSKGASVGAGGSMCLGYALDAACLMLGKETSHGALEGTPWHDRVQEIVRSDQFNRGFRINYSIPGWNDRICQSFADVKAVLVLASEQYEAERRANGDPEDEVVEPDPVRAMLRSQFSMPTAVPVTTFSYKIVVKPKELVSA